MKDKKMNLIHEALFVLFILESESGPPARSSVSVYTHVLISTLRSELLRNDSSIFVLIIFVSQLSN